MGVETESVSCDAAQGSGSGVSVLGKHKVYQNEPLNNDHGGKWRGWGGWVGGGYNNHHQGGIGS